MQHERGAEPSAYILLRGRPVPCARRVGYRFWVRPWPFWALVASWLRVLEHFYFPCFHRATIWAAERAIRSELTGPLTAMLISCQIALNLPELAPVVQNKFLALQELAKELCERLQVAA